MRIRSASSSCLRCHHHLSRLVLPILLSIRWCHSTHFGTSSTRTRIVPSATSRGGESLHHPSLSFHRCLSLLFIPRGGSSSIHNDGSMNTSNSTTEDPAAAAAAADDTNSNVMQVGGGAINEKKRTFGVSSSSSSSSSPVINMPPRSSSSSSSSSSYKATSNRAHLMHALEGLDRYPNYLSRWSLDDTEELERALEQTLAKVQRQKNQVVERRKDMQRLVDQIGKKYPEWKDFLKVPTSWDSVQRDILDPTANKAIFRSGMFRSSHNATIPSVEDVLSGQTTVELDAGYLEEIMEEESYDVYSFPVFAPAFCKKLQEYIRCVMEEMNGDHTTFAQHLNRGMIRDLDNLGLSWLNDLLLHLVVRPISRHLYKETDIRGDLDWRQGFVAAYSHSPTTSKPRQRLVPHTDDAEVTLNICLGDVFEGGNLNMWGLRGSDEAGTFLGQYEPQVGRALLHAGRHLHEVTEITSGDRFAYIMWTRSWDGIRADTCPCCWMNRRQDPNCLCGRRWN